METKSINIYTFEELTDKAKEKALNNYRENNDMYFLSDDLYYHLDEKLKENNIKPLNKLKHYFSLSYCQGDGYVFLGKFQYKNYNVVIEHRGNYYHYNSKSFYISDEEGNEANQNIYDEFNDLFVSICKQIEKIGYSIIEEENNENNIIEVFKEREYLFLSNGEVEEVRN